jgi:DNA-binding NarL/FixJ family response regulator
MRLLLVDDHKIVREGIKALLKDEPGVEVIGEVCNGKEAIEILESVKPDMILLDTNMPELGGLETLQYLKNNNFPIKVLMLSMSEDVVTIKQMMEAGALGYILKTCGKGELISALRLVELGNVYLSPSITLKLLNTDKEELLAPQKIEKEEPSISKREIEVLELIAEGYTNAEIAEKLFNSKRTIESHRRNLIEKTKSKNTAELVKYAIKHGYIKLDFSEVK